MKIMWVLLFFLLAACGEKSLLGVKNAFEVSMSADNKSSVPLAVTLDLVQAAKADNCESATASKTVNVDAGTVKEDALTLKCEHPPKNTVTLQLAGKADLANPVRWAAVALDDAHAVLKGVIGSGTEVRWRVDAATVRKGTVGSSDFASADGIKSPADDPSKVEVVTAEAMAAVPVRAAGHDVEVYFAPDVTVLDIGLPADLFESKPDAATEIDGFYHFPAQVVSFSGALALSRSLAAGKIACDDKSCTLDAQ
jgi:hypothetical protein